MTHPNLFHPDFESLPSLDVQHLQEKKWEKQWDYICNHSTFYKNKLSRFIGQPLSLSALQDLPLTDKEELRASQERCAPYGDYVACPTDKVTRIHCTSGTTGRPLILANSQKDLNIIAQQGARSMYASGLRPGDRVIHCLNYSLWTGGVTDHMTLEAAGATVIPFGVGKTKQLLETIINLGVTAISCTPSYPSLLEKVLREEFGKSPKELGLKLGLFGGEAGLDNMELRQRMEDTWGFSVRNANFGLSEIMSTMGSQCEHTTDLHFHSADTVFFEILDTSSGQRLDIKEGTTGELVCTNLEKECQPLIRYRTRDVVTITGADPCSCGRTSFRFRITGRTDDMFNVRGINVFPTAIQKVVAANSQCSGHFKINLRGSGPYDKVELEVEASEQLPKDDWGMVERLIEDDIRKTVGASAKVVLIAFESLARTAGKTSFIDRCE